MFGGGDTSDPLARPQIVVAVLQPEVLDPLGQFIAQDLFARAERVTRALADERRRLEVSEVPGAKLAGLPGGWNG
jgi:hypothetical protein